MLYIVNGWLDGWKGEMAGKSNQPNSTIATKNTLTTISFDSLSTIQFYSISMYVAGMNEVPKGF